MTVSEYRNYYSRLNQPLQNHHHHPVISRERHVSIGSSSARSNSISARAADSCTTDSNSERFLTAGNLNYSASAVSAHLKAKLRQMRNGIPTGKKLKKRMFIVVVVVFAGSIGGGSCKMFGQNNLMSNGIMSGNAANKTLMEVEFNVIFCC